MPIDAATGRSISPMTTAAWCIKPRPLHTAAQARKVHALKVSLSEFAAMRHLAIRFRGLLRGSRSAQLKRWLDDAGHMAMPGTDRLCWSRVAQDYAAMAVKLRAVVLTETADMEWNAQWPKRAGGGPGGHAGRDGVRGQLALRAAGRETGTNSLYRDFIVKVSKPAGTIADRPNL